MWIRVRLDIGWRDLAAGVYHGLFSRNRDRAVSAVESSWSNDADSLACLSVRTGLDLLLQSMQLPPGTEVLYSAVTIPDMPYIAKEHGLVAVPVELTGADFRIEAETLRRAISPKSKVIVVAHLFGAISAIDDVLQVARENSLFVVEDCAQAWCGPEFRGHPQADATFFSFGMIKTGTALGGALLRVADRQLLEEMRRRESEYPVQSQVAYTQSVLKAGVLKVISSRPGFGLLARLAKLKGLTVEEMLNSLTKGFPLSDLFDQIRRRPCPALLRLLLRRLTTYDRRNLDRRMANARGMMHGSGWAPDELLDDSHTFWLFPFQTDRPQELVAALHEVGIDSARYGSLRVVPAPDGRPDLACINAESMLDQTVFVPCYAGMSSAAIERAAEVLARFRLDESGRTLVGAKADAVSGA